MAKYLSMMFLGSLNPGIKFGIATKPKHLTVN